MTTTTDLNGLFKDVYADKLVTLIPENALLVKEIPFESRAKQLGNKYHQPVVVNMEHGVTYAAADAGAFALNAAISMKTQDATVQGAQMVLRSTMDYEAAARAASGKNAFYDSTGLQVENMMGSLTKRLELSMWYGASPTGLGLVDSHAAGTATTCTLTFAAAGWAGGIWAGCENATLDIFKVSDNTKVNTTASVIVTSYDSSARTMLITGVAADITAIVAMAGADTYVRFAGAVGNEMSGIDRILTASGSIFGIDNSVYNLWKGSTYAVGGALTFLALQNAMAIAVERGGLDEKVKVYINPKKWTTLLNDQAALRKYDSSYKTTSFEQGANSLKFYGQSGEMEIVAHPFIKEGEGFILPVKRIRRIGAQDIGFEIPGSKTGEIFTQLQSNAGFEYRLYSNQAIIAETPAKLVKLTGIS